MLNKKMTVGVLLLALPLSYGGHIHASGASVVTSITQQEEKVIGTITDDFGPVAGVSVIVKGTTNGTVTDMDGKFVLSKVKRGDIFYWLCDSRGEIHRSRIHQYPIERRL